MSVPSAHVLCAIDVDGTIVGGVTSQNILNEAELRATGRSGEVYARQQHLVGQAVRAPFSTENVMTLLDLLTGTGPSLDIDGLTNGIALYAQKLADGSTRAGAGSHKKYTFHDGIAVARTLDCAHRGDFSLAAEVVATWDETNDLLVIADSQNAPTIPDAARFSIGPVTLESLLLTGVTNVNLDFGIEVRTLGSDSDVWDSQCAILTIKPVLTIQGINVDWLKSDVIPLIGKEITHTNTSIYLRKRLAGGTWVADETEEHVLLTMAGRAIVSEPFNASEDGNADVTVRVEGVYDGTNAPVAVSTGVAIE